MDYSGLECPHSGYRIRKIFFDLIKFSHNFILIGKRETEVSKFGFCFFQPHNSINNKL